MSPFFSCIPDSKVCPLIQHISLKLPKPDVPNISPVDPEGSTLRVVSVHKQGLINSHQPPPCPQMPVEEQKVFGNSTSKLKQRGRGGRGGRVPPTASLEFLCCAAQPSRPFAVLKPPLSFEDAPVKEPRGHQKGAFSPSLCVQLFRRELVQPLRVSLRRVGRLPSESAPNNEIAQRARRVILYLEPRGFHQVVGVVKAEEGGRAQGNCSILCTSNTKRLAFYFWLNVLFACCPAP
mmetsp:Transcript_23679/g.46520  ORF Transcript_23679/g.46520 Transcript_23679/m.46520 type:complete len:235 (-) Transcript_23679:592-1296(-)